MCSQTQLTGSGLEFQQGHRKTVPSGVSEDWGEAREKEVSHASLKPCCCSAFSLFNRRLGENSWGRRRRRRRRRCRERQRYSTYTGSETDTYIWSQQGSPEICFCAGGNRVYSQAFCDLKTCPDQKGCPGPCLRERVRWTQSGGWELEGGGHTIKQPCSSTGFGSPDTRGYDLGKTGINMNDVHLLYLCQRSWTSWRDVTRQKIHCDLPHLVGRRKRLFHMFFIQVVICLESQFDQFADIGIFA